MADRSDFVQVQLTQAGSALAGEGTLRVSNGRRSYVFTSGESVEVERSYEWNAWLSRHTAPDGTVLFEIAAAAATTK